MILYNLLRICLLPILYLFYFTKKFQSKLLLEKKYSFYQNYMDQFDYTFEISSVGELEQVYDLICHYLESKKNVHLIFFSPSVEDDCLKIKSKYPKLKLSNLPLITYKPFKFKIRSNYLMMVRYDFLPELIFSLKHTRGVLFSATHKSLKSGFIKRSYYKWAMDKFSLIFVSNIEESKKLKLLLKDPIIEIADLRKNRIIKRQQNSLATINKTWPAFQILHDYLQRIENSKIIFGSYWNSDEKNLNSLDIADPSNFIAVFPHNLGQISINKKSIYLITSNTSRTEVSSMIKLHSQRGGIWQFEVKGILCEAYSFFDIAYVGGGFGESIHSLLEPYLANCFTYFGPNNKRSTERDDIMAINPTSVCEIKNGEKINLENRFTPEQSPSNYPDCIKISQMVEYRL